MNKYSYRFKPHREGKIFRYTQTCLICLGPYVLRELWRLEATPLCGLYIYCLMAITNYSRWGQFSWAVSDEKNKKSQGFESSLTQSCSVESVLHSIDSTFLLHCDKNLSLTSAIGFSRE